MSDRNSFFIGGEWVKPATSRQFKIVNATTEEIIALVPEAAEADVDRAVAAARHAFEHSGWATCAPAERAAVMRRFVAALQTRSLELASTVSRQNGMPRQLSDGFEGGFSIGVLSYYAELAASVTAEDSRPSQMGLETIVGRGPIGVVAAIVPWNFPITLAMSKIGPALAAGCTMVIKPSPGTVLDSYLLAEAAIEAGIPAGVLNWVAADREVGAYLVSHPGIDKVAFTGSTVAGRSIARTCGELLRPVTLELGGKSAAIILDDANLDIVIAGLQQASLMNNGQACINGTRILAPASRYGQVVDALASMASSLMVGDPLDLATQVGPMASSAHRDRVEGYIAKGKSEARLVAGGGRPKNLGRGWFVEPTVFADVSNSATIAREEIFGPVLSIISYTDETDAVRIANDSIYGLGGSVWGVDTARAKNVARRVQTGTIGVNGYVPAIGSPFGGVKASGLGREFGPEALASYQQLKSMYVMA
ncbi:MAG: aldehyde dehydrogenase [Hydrocarboniphaga sp.]|uniref:aldehyde dehydrogenase n=1 Tax=Hydrocarboniphaga sp. TaxID=2033016 RepID=UPI0026109048|nr:aldehyde dehydrogenase [Hydrocarboniphaga sp.]MDB5971902.1 aldehyde dehydrogenase [Hydrocarboniphaga sp.]